jgi:hypothetical protein
VKLAHVALNKENAPKFTYRIHYKIYNEPLPRFENGAISLILLLNPFWQEHEFLII